MIMKRNLILMLLFLVAFITVKAQRTDTIPMQLTKKQMYADFDELVDIIKTYNAQQIVRKKLTNYDMISEIKRERKKINTIDSYWQFISFLEICLKKTIDVHAQMRALYYVIPSPRYAPGQSFYDSTFIREISDGYANYKQLLREKAIQNFDRTLTMTFYLDGDYYLYGTYHFYNRNSPYDSVVFENAKILKHNNQGLDKFVMTQIGRLPPATIRWDNNYKKYYTDWLILKGGLFEVEDYKTKQIYRFNSKNYNLNLSGFSIPDIKDNISNYIQNKEETSSQVIMFFEPQKTLYIYTDRMWGDIETFTDSIKTVGRNKSIEKIIIDVRNNHGGGDDYWLAMLSAIIKDTLYYEYTLALNYNDKVIRYFNTEFPEELTKPFKKENVKIFNNTPMYVANYESSQIIPDENSLAYSGNIYILQDENTYSSGHSFAALARQIPQLVSVGLPTGNLAGFGFNPWGFQLKHSKFTFEFETAIDLTQANKIEDIFQSIPEIEVYPTIDEYIRYSDYGNLLNKKSETFLFRYDYLFKRTLELK